MVLAAAFLAAATFGPITVTNHSGHVVSGELGAVTNGTFVLSARRLPLSILPPAERERVRQQAGLDVRTPREKRIAADLALELRRIDARLDEGDVSAEKAEELRREARAAAAYRQEHRRRAPSR